jgi:purine-cytosine permease-like protein
MRELVALVFAVGFALIVGYFTARSSSRREKIYGGAPAYFFHYLGAAAFTGLLPGVLGSIVLGVGRELVAPIALGFLAITFAALVLFAVIEQPARANAKHEDRGWTAEDARKSGL